MLLLFSERFKEDQIQVVLLSGGTARLPGLVVYMAEQLGIETQIVNPFVGINEIPGLWFLMPRVRHSQLLLDLL